MPNSSFLIRNSTFLIQVRIDEQSSKIKLTVLQQVTICLEIDEICIEIDGLCIKNDRFCTYVLNDNFDGNGQGTEREILFATPFAGGIVRFIFKKR